MLSLKGDLHKETKVTPKSFERSLDEDTAILKNCEFEEYWELSNSNRSIKTKVRVRVISGLAVRAVDLINCSWFVFSLNFGE